MALIKILTNIEKVKKRTRNDEEASHSSQETQEDEEKDHKQTEERKQTRHTAHISQAHSCDVILFAHPIDRLYVFDFTRCDTLRLVQRLFDRFEFNVIIARLLIGLCRSRKRNPLVRIIIPL